MGSFDDYFVCRGAAAEELKVFHFEPRAVNGAALAPLPFLIAAYRWPTGLAMSLPKVAIYFARISNTYEGEVRARFFECLRVEYTFRLVCSFYREARLL